MPILVPLLTTSFLKMVHIAVDIAAAMPESSAVMRQKNAIGMAPKREYRERGARNTPMKEVMVAVRKKPNMTREARRMILRYVTTSLGSDTGKYTCYQQAGSRKKEFGSSGKHILVAPLKSSFNSISTGLNQYSVRGLLQPVIPSPTYPSQKFQSPTW